MASKAELRRSLRRWRHQQRAEERNSRFDAAIAHLKQDPRWARAQVVALYAALPDEPDLYGLMDEVHARGGTVALPVVAQRHSPLRWRAHLPGAPLVPSSFGVPEPPADAPVVDPATIELVVVPGLAVDDRGIRLGYGGGYYDRSLPLMPRAWRVWVGQEAQLRRVLPSESTDEPVHAVATENGLAPRPIG